MPGGLPSTTCDFCECRWDQEDVGPHLPHQLLVQLREAEIVTDGQAEVADRTVQHHGTQMSTQWLKLRSPSPHLPTKNKYCPMAFATTTRVSQSHGPRSTSGSESYPAHLSHVSSRPPGAVVLDSMRTGPLGTSTSNRWICSGGAGDRSGFRSFSGDNSAVGGRERGL